MNLTMVEVEDLQEATHVMAIEPHEKLCLIDGKLYDIRVKEYPQSDENGWSYDPERYIVDEKGREFPGFYNPWTQIKLYKEVKG